MNNELQLTLVQFNIDNNSTAINLQKIENLLNHTVNKPVIILLPELFTSGFAASPQKVATSMDGEVVQWMISLATAKAAVVAGSVAIREHRGYFNRFIVAHPCGKLEWYDKRHLFRMGGETEQYTAGDKRVIVTIDKWRVGLFVCYDLRFPVWSRSINNYDLALYVANWPSARATAWETLLKARAIENQCYVAAVNRVGKDGLGDYNGNSLVVDFRGDVVGSFPKGEEGLVETTISLDALNNFKASFPAWMDADQFSIHDAI